MMCSDPHWVQCGCTGLMSHGCEHRVRRRGTGSMSHRCDIWCPLVGFIENNMLQFITSCLSQQVSHCLFSTLTNTCQALMLLGLPPFLMNGPMLAILLPFSCMCSQGNYPQEGYWQVGGCYLPVDVGLDVMQLNLCIISSLSV